MMGSRVPPTATADTEAVQNVFKGPGSGHADTSAAALEAGQNGLPPWAALIHLLVPHPQIRVVHPLDSTDPEGAKCQGHSLRMNHQPSWG